MKTASTVASVNFRALVGCALLSIALPAGVQAQPRFDVRGSAPFETSLDGARYPSYGLMLLRCDAGRCALQKTSFFCDGDDPLITQAAVTADRIRITKAPSGANTQLAFEVDDFGNSYGCIFGLKRGTAPGTTTTLHVESYVCGYTGSDGKRRVERSVDELDLKKVCKVVVLKKSPW